MEILEKKPLQQTQLFENQKNLFMCLQSLAQAMKKMLQNLP